MTLMSVDGWDEEFDLHFCGNTISKNTFRGQKIYLPLKKKDDRLKEPVVGGDSKKQCLLDITGLRHI